MEFVFWDVTACGNLSSIGFPEIKKKQENGKKKERYLEINKKFAKENKDVSSLKSLQNESRAAIYLPAPATGAT